MGVEDSGVVVFTRRERLRDLGMTSGAENKGTVIHLDNTLRSSLVPPELERKIKKELRDAGVGLEGALRAGYGRDSASPEALKRADRLG